MNRVKFVLKNIFYNANILRETRKISKEKYNKKINMNNHIKIFKRHYNTANPGPNKNPNKNPNNNNFGLFVITCAILGQFYYIRK